MLTVKQLINQLSQIKPSLQDTQVVVRAANGEVFSPDIKFVLRDRFNMDKTPENVEFVILVAE